MATKALQGLHVNFISEGNGPPVILVHGAGGSLHHWDYLFPELVSHKYQVYALDLLGHGESAKPDSNGSGYHIDAFYAHMANWISMLDLHTAPILIGHGMGAYLVLTYVLRNPGRSRGIVLSNPYFTPDQLSFPMRFPMMRPHLSVKILTMAPRWTISSIFRLIMRSRDQFPREARGRLTDDVKRSDPAVITFARTTHDLTPHVRRIQTQTIVIWGKNDLLFSLNYYPQLVETIPNAVSSPLQGGHHLHLTNARLFNNQILKFLDQLCGGVLTTQNALSPRNLENALGNTILP